MINIKIIKNNNNYFGYEVTGHSDYAESGSDIICSAVSILAYTVLNSIVTIGNIDCSNLSYIIGEEEGNMEVTLDETNLKTNVILETFEIGIKLLLEDYSQYINLDYKEV